MPGADTVGLASVVVFTPGPTQLTNVALLWNDNVTEELAHDSCPEFVATTAGAGTTVKFNT